MSENVIFGDDILNELPARLVDYEEFPLRIGVSRGFHSDAVQVIPHTSPWAASLIARSTAEA